jgi:hypothetical protein
MRRILWGVMALNMVAALAFAQHSPSSYAGREKGGGNTLRI